MRCWTLVLLIALHLGGMSDASRAAAAEPDDARSAALTLAREGAQLYAAGDFQGALEKFEQAYGLFPSPKLFFNLGQAWRGLSKPAQALANFERFLAEAKDAPADYRDQAAVQIAELETRVTRVAVACNRSGSVVTIDGVRRGTIPLDRPIPVEPGAHRLTLAWKDETRAVEFTAVAGQVLPLTLTFEGVSALHKVSEAPPKAERQISLPITPVPLATSRESAHRHTWYWVAGGVVVAAVATALILVYTTRDHYPSADLGTRTLGEP